MSEITTEEYNANRFTPVGIHVPNVTKIGNMRIGLGDILQMSPIPENHYKYFKKKLVDTNKSWIFDHNPYVLRDVETESNIFSKTHSHIHGFNLKDGKYTPAQKTVINLDLKDPNMILSSRQQIYCEKFGIKEVACRNTRLYKYEDPSEVKKDQVVIHGHSTSTKESIDEDVMKHIKQRYASYKLIQVGGKGDPDLGIIDRRGLNWWAVVELIARSAIFIGVNSGPMNIANCYPHINKKVIINTKQTMFTQDMVEAFYPLGGHVDHHFQWLDYGWQYYNDTEFDLGATYSYEKI